MSDVPDLSTCFSKLRRPMRRNRQPSRMGGSCRSQQGQTMEPQKIITCTFLNTDVQFNKAEKAWKPRMCKAGVECDEDPEMRRTQELLRRVRGILNKLTPEMFQQLTKQLQELTINTEERLQGVTDLIFEKAISEPIYSSTYANMCHCLMRLRVPITDNPGSTVIFHTLLLNRCQKEFDNMLKELDAASVEEEKQHLTEKLEDVKGKARRRSLGNIKLIGELFKLKMLTEQTVHNCVVKLLKNQSEESLEYLCLLLSTTGRKLDLEKSKCDMDQYFSELEKIVEEKKTSSRISFMLQDLLNLRLNNWVPSREYQGPRTISQVHKEVLEEHDKQEKVQQHLAKKYHHGGGWSSRGCGRLHQHDRRSTWPQNNGRNTIPIFSTNRPTDTSCLRGIGKPRTMKPNNQLLSPGDNGICGSCGKGHNGGSGVKPSSKSDVGWRSGTTMKSNHTEETFFKETCKLLDRMFQDEASSQKIYECVKANLDEIQTRSNMFVHALMTSMCRSAITGKNPYREISEQIRWRATLLQKYLTDEQKKFQALDALQALVVTMEQPANLVHIFLDKLCKEGVIQKDTFYRWQSSVDPASRRARTWPSPGCKKHRCRRMTDRRRPTRSWL